MEVYLLEVGKENSNKIDIKLKCDGEVEEYVVETEIAKISNTEIHLMNAGSDLSDRFSLKPDILCKICYYVGRYNNGSVELPFCISE